MSNKLLPYHVHPLKLYTVNEIYQNVGCAIAAN